VTEPRRAGPKTVAGVAFADVGSAARAIDGCIHTPLRANEAAAVLSLAFNAGPAAVCKSTMVRLINEGQPAATWCREFTKWVFAGGRKIKGLVNRRNDEMKLCLGWPQPTPATGAAPP
jgi:lysozyme